MGLEGQPNSMSNISASSRYIRPDGSFRYLSKSVERNSLIFAILLLCIQIGICLIYGFMFYTPPGLINISSIITTIGLALLVVAGFGLIFGYTMKLTWSGIGFTLFITALCLEIYPLINAFWTRVQLQTQNSPLIGFTWDQRKSNNLFLSNRQTLPDLANSTYYGNCMTNALKCALAVAVAFSAIIGRAGQLECLIVTLLGAAGFEFNRQLLQQKYGADGFGSCIIFTFGGFMGLSLGLFQFLRVRVNKFAMHEISYKKYSGSQDSVLLACLGSLIIFALFPLLAYQIDAYVWFSQYNVMINPLCVILAMGAGALGGICGSAAFEGIVIARDVIHGCIAGAIAVGTSSLYITLPVYAVLSGCVGGLVQSFLQNLIQKKSARNKNILSTVSWMLFGIQGLIGAGFAAGWKAIAFTYIGSNGYKFIPDQLSNFNSQNQFYIGLISAGIGAGVGIFAGVLVYACNDQTKDQYYEDYIYWLEQDQIRYYVEPSAIIVPPEQKITKPTPVADTPQSQYQFQSAKSESVNYAYL